MFQPLQPMDDTMAWNTKHEMVGQTVEIQTLYGEYEMATVLAVSTTTTNIRVRSHDDDEIMIGNQWDDV